MSSILIILRHKGICRKSHQTDQMLSFKIAKRDKESKTVSVWVPEIVLESGGFLETTTQPAGMTWKKPARRLPIKDSLSVLPSVLFSQHLYFQMFEKKNIFRLFFLRNNRLLSFFSSKSFWLWCNSARYGDIRPPFKSGLRQNIWYRLPDKK